MNDLALLPTKEELDVIQVMAKAASESKYFEKMGGAAAIFSIGLYAREIGIPLMTALHGGLVPVMGKITMSADMMNSLIRQKGHKLEILETTSTVCRIKGTRKDTGESYTCSFSIEDARRAGLVKSGGGYEKHTDDMLFARCISKLKRRLFPDVASRAYVHGELDEEPKEVKEEVETIEEGTAAKAPSVEEELAAFKTRFQPIENLDYDLTDFLMFITGKSKKFSHQEIIRQALESPEKFAKSYLKWVEEKSEENQHMNLEQATLV
jgi:hypothetical protein